MLILLCRSSENPKRPTCEHCDRDLKQYGLVSGCTISSEVPDNAREETAGHLVFGSQCGKKMPSVIYYQAIIFIAPIYNMNSKWLT